jgi:hypothetical protein
MKLFPQFVRFRGRSTKFRLALNLVFVYSLAAAPCAQSASIQPLAQNNNISEADAPAEQSLATAILATIRQQTTLAPPPAASGFGSSVSLSGSRALVGSFRGSDGVTGSAYVFVFDGRNWTLEAELKASDGVANDSFGNSVSLSGNRALVGADFHGNAGAAYVFVLNGTTWTQEAKLTPSDGQTEEDFGSSVSLAGGRALIGAFNDAEGTGSAYVFTLRNGIWSQTAKLTPPTGDTGGLFGNSVSLSGKRALIGAFAINDQTGAGYVFALSGSTWTLESELQASDAMQFSSFAYSVSRSGDRALIGAPVDDNGAFGNGAAYTFAFDGTTWIQEAKLTGSIVNNDDFGWSVSLFGERALVGAIGVTRDTGMAYLFSFDGSAWNLQDNLFASGGDDNDQFGFSVSLSKNRALVGAHGAEVNGFFTGAAYVFGLH